jgi:N-methylhydantoinase A
MKLDGPALIVEDGTTTVVPMGFSAGINAVGQIVLEDVT